MSEKIKFQLLLKTYITPMFRLMESVFSVVGISFTKFHNKQT